MTEKKEKNNKISLPHLLTTLTIIATIIGFFVFFDGRIDKKVEASPVVIRLQTQYIDIGRQLDGIQKQLTQLQQDVNRRNSNDNRNGGR